MRRLGFAFNPTRPATFELRDRALTWCGDQGLEAWALESNDQPALVGRLPSTDCLIVLGGDGTFLRAARALAEVDVPVLGINSGRVGFLSKAEPDGLERVLSELAAGEYTLEPRMMLEARIEGADGRSSDAFAGLNDAALVRGSQVRVVHIEVAVGSSHVATWIADGVIVSTPTGSTAYSFSAGGPILDPTARNLVVTPVAAYLSAVRSIVVGPQHTVSMRVIDGGDCMVSIDGREDRALDIGDRVVVRALERPLRLVEPRGAVDFWELLRRKAALLPR
ncbi:MAG TPA: NAD(+)/NADH kinase [Candidatus Limnocylindrales bacterium]|nr:NAD(+)/NADH kinase [Candidatus Limnocylindrales bacterium]